MMYIYIYIIIKYMFTCLKLTMIFAYTRKQCFHHFSAPTFFRMQGEVFTSARLVLMAHWEDRCMSVK